VDQDRFLDRVLGFKLGEKLIEIMDVPRTFDLGSIITSSLPPIAATISVTSSSAHGEFSALIRGPQAGSAELGGPSPMAMKPLPRAPPWRRRNGGLPIAEHDVDLADQLGHLAVPFRRAAARNESCGSSIDWQLARGAGAPMPVASSPWRRPTEFGATGLWTRINALNSPWALDDVTEIVAAIGGKLDVMMLPKVEGAWDIHYLDQLLAQLEAKHAVKKPILIHAILETAQGVNNVESIAAASPRMHGMSLGPADLAASRGMKPPASAAASGLHRAGRRQARRFAPEIPAGPLAHTTARWSRLRGGRHQTFYGPFGDFSDLDGCESQFRQRLPDGLRRRLVAASDANRHRQALFRPNPAEVCDGEENLDAMPDGSAR